MLASALPRFPNTVRPLGPLGRFPQKEPVAFRDGGQPVTVKYTGTKKVKSVKAVKK